MSTAGIIPPDLLKKTGEIGRTDILIGIPSYNNARTIGHVVRAINAGLAKYFPEKKAILVNSDGGSTDGTADVVRGTSIQDCKPLLLRHPLHTIHRIVTPYHGIPGKGSAIRTIMGIAGELDAQACAIVDADLRSITPEWVELLIGPVLSEGFDFVAPLYHRHKYDGTITNSIVYPLTRALYGQRIRQPIGGDFGFSGRYARHLPGQDVWHTDVARFGIDIWMTTTAVVNRFRVCQAFLGAKIHDAKDPAADLTAMLSQVVGSVFSLMESHHPQWKDIRGSQPVPLFGFEYTVGLEPVPVNIQRLLDSFQGGVRDLAPVWCQIMEPDTWQALRQISGASQSNFHYPAELWVRTVLDFSRAYHRRIMNREHILRALIPLYLARTASFVLETSEASSSEVENIMEDLCLRYEARKEWIASRWDQ